MTDNQATALRLTADAEFAQLAKRFEFEVAGPSARGSWLVRDTDNRAWLFSSMRTATWGRECQLSVWTDLNVSVMNQKEVTA